ncbi:MAG: hypothetical protein ACTIJK_03535, partial [Brachybacterium sp.]
MVFKLEVIIHHVGKAKGIASTTITATTRSVVRRRPRIRRGFALAPGLVAVFALPPAVRLGVSFSVGSALMMDPPPS